MEVGEIVALRFRKCGCLQRRSTPSALDWGRARESATLCLSMIQRAGFSFLWFGRMKKSINLLKVRSIIAPGLVAFG